MALRCTLYRCHLFSFGGPQTEGVLSRWSQNLEPVGDREVLSGERVELMVTVDATRHTLDASTCVRFDILEQDHFLTGGLDDRIVSLVGTDAPDPEEGFTVRNLTTRFSSLDVGQSLTDYVRNYRRTYPDMYKDQILILEHQQDDERAYLILAWWLAERLEDYANSEYYFVVNVDEQFEDQSEDILDVSSTQAPAEEQVSAAAGVISGPDLTAAPLSEEVSEVYWVSDQLPVMARPGETVQMEAIRDPAYTPTNGRFLVLVDAPIGHQVASIECEAGEGVLCASWTVELLRELALPARFKLVYTDRDDVVLASECLEVRDRLEALVLDQDGEPLADTAWTAQLIGGENVYRGVTDQNGRLVDEDVLAGRYELEIEGRILIPDEATRRSTAHAEESRAATTPSDNAHNIVYTFGLSRSGLVGVETSLDPVVQE